MNNDPDATPEPPLDVDDLRPHSFDGIQEYDKRLPNWWLFTLYGSIVFAFGYWSLVHHWNVTKEPGQAVTDQIQQNALIAAKSSGAITDEQMWALSKGPGHRCRGPEHLYHHLRGMPWAESRGQSRPDPHQDDLAPRRKTHGNHSHDHQRRRRQGDADLGARARPK